MTIHSHHSSYREALLEHLFVGELQRHLWSREDEPVLIEVLEPQVDDAGYDLVLECNGVTRHVQLKSSFTGSRTAIQKIHVKLAQKASGCVIWIRFDPETMELGPFLWFGGMPGKPIPSLDGYKVARHTKGDATGHKAERPNLRVVPKGSFEPLDSIGDVADRLFSLRAVKVLLRPNTYKASSVKGA